MFFWKNGDELLNNTILRDIDEFFAIAQLLARDEKHAATMVERAMKIRTELPELSAPDLLSIVYSEESPQLRSMDMLQVRRVRGELQAMIPRAFVALTPLRRVAVRRAFLGDDGEATERSTFMHRMRRTLDNAPAESGSYLITETDVSFALRHFLESTLAPTPPSLLSTLESKYVRPIPRSGASMRTDIAPAKKIKPSIAVRIAGGLLLILIASAIGTWIASPSGGNDSEATAQRTQLLSLIDGHTVSSELAFQGSDGFQIERVIRDRLKRMVAAPRIADATLIGVSFEALAPSVLLPVIHYESDMGFIFLFVLDYSLIQAVEGYLTFDIEVLNQVADPRGLDIYAKGDISRITFRHRDDIYVTHTKGNPQVFRNRILFD